MTPEQTGKVLATVRVLWPHSVIGDPADTVRVWHAMLGAFDEAEVQGAVAELAATGDRHAPAPGVVVSILTERAHNAPGFPEARLEILRAIRGYRPPRDVAQENPYAAPPSEYWSHPVVAAFAENVWDEWRMAPDPDSSDARVASDARTFHAQQRDAYKALRARTLRDTALAAVGAPRRAGPRRLEPGAGVAHLELVDGGER